MKLENTCWVVVLATGLGLMPTLADQRGQLWTEHSDIRVVYDPSLKDPLHLGVQDEDHRILFAPTNVVLHVAESSRISLPSGTPFGERGESMWILPQSQDPALLYLGFSAEGLPRDLFSAPLKFRLISVEGPGGFAAWQAGAFGRLDVKFNSMDGIDEADQTSPIIGSHEHFNWGFKAPGVYAVTFRVEGQLSVGSQTLQSPPATFLFHVAPLPPPARFEDFAERTWHPDLLPVAGGPGSDPDGDGFANEWEFYTGSDPCVPDVPDALTLQQGDQSGVVRLQYSERAGLADGVGLVLQRSSSLSGPWMNVEESGQFVIELGFKRWTFDVERSNLEGAVFFRLQSMP